MWFIIVMEGWLLSLFQAFSFLVLFIGCLVGPRNYDSDPIIFTDPGGGSEPSDPVEWCHCAVPCRWVNSKYHRRGVYLDAFRGAQGRGNHKSCPLQV